MDWFSPLISNFIPFPETIDGRSFLLWRKELKFNLLLIGSNSLVQKSFSVAFSSTGPACCLLWARQPRISILFRHYRYIHQTSPAYLGSCCGVRRADSHLRVQAETHSSNMGPCSFMGPGRYKCGWVVVRFNSDNECLYFQMMSRLARGVRPRLLYLG